MRNLSKKKSVGMAVGLIIALSIFFALKPINSLHYDAHSVFRFEDHNDLYVMIQAMQVLLPVGIKKNDVDLILINSGGASLIEEKSEDYRYKIKYIYRYKPRSVSQIFVPFDWIFVVFYNEQNQLDRLIINGKDVHSLPENYNAAFRSK